MTPMNSRLLLALAALSNLPVAGQVKLQPTLAAPTLQTVEPAALLPADLLPAGKTVGAFHLTGLVRADRTVVLRWANDHGEMPTEGVSVFRQKVGDSSWKDLTGKHPVGYLQGRAAEKRLDRLDPESRERVLAFAFGDVRHDPATRLRSPLAAPDGPTRAKDLKPERAVQQFRSLRMAGQLSQSDLMLLTARADLETGMAELLGLTYVDDPGKGTFRYKIVVKLPEGGSVEVVCPRDFDTRQPTVVPQPLNLSAGSGNGEVLLNWDETPNEVVAGYNVYRSASLSGPWKKLNADPVKKVTLELEDPAVSLRRAAAQQAVMARVLKPLPSVARTPQKVNEAYLQAVKETADPKTLPALSPAAETALQGALAKGKLRPGGPQAPASAYTDSRRTEGNQDLVDEQTYQYKVTAVDLGGLEQPLDTAPVVAGTPRDLEPPSRPGKPALKGEREALDGLAVAQQQRLKDARLAQLTVATAAPGAATLTPFHPGATGAITGAAAPAMTPGLVLDAQRMRLARTAETMPVSSLKKVADATLLHSGADGSVPPAVLVWGASPEGDVKGYEVYRASGSGTLAKVAEVAVPTYTDTALEVGQAYRYAIAAVDQRGNVSLRSPEGLVEVSDSGLPARLAVMPPASKVSQEAPASAPQRRLGRPLGRMLAAGSLRGASAPRAGIHVTKLAAEPLVAEFQAPKAVPAAKVHAFRPVAAAAAASPVQALAPKPAGTFKASAVVKPRFVPVARSFNPMLHLPKAAPELFVLLEWARPLQGFPMEYEVQQAPRKMELVSVARPSVHHLSVFKDWATLRPTTTPATLAPSGAKLAAGATPAPAAGKPLAASELLVSTPQLHAAVARGLVASQGKGLKLADARLNQTVSLQASAGPGVFSRINEAPVTTERFVASFPAEVAQYGGATFYFRVKAATKEFGRRVEGPLGDPIEVHLPDIVPPPSPIVGAIDLREGGAGRLDASLTWTQLPTPDLAGFLVNRQEMTYQLKDGEAHAVAPTGPNTQLTPSAIAGTTYLDSRPPAGFQRYTLRSVDKTGNISEPLGSLDILVPGEPVPGAPTQLALSGAQLTWKASEDAAGYTVWRSFTGQDDDYDCISAVLGSGVTSFTLPPEGRLHLKVVARSASGMNQTPSQALVRTP